MLPKTAYISVFAFINLFLHHLVYAERPAGSELDETIASTGWTIVDDFEEADALSFWVSADTDNRTEPHIENPQVMEVHSEDTINNRYLLKKPAIDGLVGNRKALSFRPLPFPVLVGDITTFYTRVSVEYFPNNHSFGLSNLDDRGILENNYNAFEPMIRITDKYESNGDKNDGTLMVMIADKTYTKIKNFEQGTDAKPMETDTWYELWYVVNNDLYESGGQRYDLYVRGGEFDSQRLVYQNAEFRMKREMALRQFITISNTGPRDAPYGNGGVRYDDIYMAQGLNLNSPLK